MSARAAGGSGAIASDLGVAVVVARSLRHVQVDVVDGQARAFAGTCGERLARTVRGCASRASCRARSRSRGCARSALNVSIWRRNPPLMPRISSFSASSPSTLTVTIVRARLRPAMRARRSRRCGRSGSRWSGKCRIARRDQPVTIGLEDVVDVRPEEDLAAGQVDPVDIGVLSHERDDFLRRQFVGRLALPDVARLARYWHQ